MFYKFKPFQGPEVYQFKDPDTGMEFASPDKSHLIQRIQSYRHANKLEDIEHLPFIIESYNCTLPGNIHKCEVIEVTPRGFFGYLKGGIALLKNLMYKSFAPQEVADARSIQCSKCPFNVFPDQGGFIEWSNQIAIASVGERKSKMHEKLGECAACSCPLKAKVFINEELSFDKEVTEKLKSVNCWQLGLVKNG